MDKEREHSKFIIQRYDTYISGANTKGSFLLAFNTFLCGGIISNYKTLAGLIEPAYIRYLNVSLIVLFILGLITTTLIMRAVHPFLKSGNSSLDKYHSNIFFMSVAAYDNDKAFTESYRKQSDNDVEEDMAKQAYHLAKGLKSKYSSLTWSMRLVFIELLLLLTILIILSIY